MRASLVIACRNAAAWLPRCLASINDLAMPVEVILVDDGSTDGSAGIAEAAGARVLRREARGRAAALNAGIAEAKGEIILFTDADCVVGPDWADRLIEKIDEGYDGVGGNLLPSAWTAIETAKVLRYLHEFERDFVLEGAYTRFCLNGNNMAVRADALARAGGFDERYVHGADADLTRRLLVKGCRLLRTRDIETTHLKIDTPRTFLRTFFHRGSAVRFADGDRSPRAQSLARAYLAPVARALADARRIPAMRRRFPQIDIAALVAAPFWHLLADWRAAGGQRHYRRVFSREART
ncbi:glycosyltransferase [bacterium]|nr:glycosyltransferase [bacterium]